MSHDLEFRVSQAEVFRRWLEDSDADMGWILSELTRDEPTEAMLKGTAFHKALELIPSDLEFEQISADGYTFIFDIEAMLYAPRMREIRLAKNYGDISISGCVDCISGNLITDYKTAGHFDAEKYVSGYAWRFYLDIFHANTFRWNVFEMDEEESMVYRVKALHVLEQFRYPELEQDCRALAHKLRDFAREYLRPSAA